MAIEKKIGFKNVGALKSAKKKAGISKYLSDKMIKWALSIVEDLEERIEDDEKDKKSEAFIKSSSFNMPNSNLTLRVAWHDNKWNGTICNDPANNTYCNGFHSLLSERIRKRKDENMAKEISNRGKAISNIDYLPPCFWSANLFSEKSIKVKHDNPAAPNLETIEEKLPANSILSWPFAVSFTRTQKEQNESGAYPKNLESVRIPRFNAKIHENKSIAFMYAKFSNPITEEEQQYLVVGAGIVDNKQQASDIKHFGPASEIKSIKERPRGNFKYRNFPSMNWAMRFSFDNYATVRMPYHEYLDEAERLEETDRDEFLKNIKVAISEPELEWCFKYVAMDIGDDEAIYILTKMRKSLMTCRDDGVVPVEEMQERIEKVENLLEMAWSSRSYFPGFVSISRVLLHQNDEPDFPLEQFYEDFKIDAQQPDKELEQVLNAPRTQNLSKKVEGYLIDLVDRLAQKGLTIEQFLNLAMLNLKPFQFQRILDGKLRLSDDWIRKFDESVKRSHNPNDIIENPYLLYEDYEYWPDSHDDVYGEELDAPIDIFKIDIAYFPHPNFQPRIDLQRKMSFIDKRRIRALIVRHLNTLENSGDCFADANALQQVMANYPLYYEIGKDYQVPPQFFYPINSEYANHFQDEYNKLVLVEENDTMYYYLSEVYNAEKNIEEKIHELLRASSNSDVYPELDDYLNKSVLRLKENIGDEFDEVGFRDERNNLYQNIFSQKLFVVSGNAGSGKSYEILNILTHLETNQNQKYLLLAPTGKAALRLSSDGDFPNITASTIDKFIADVKYHKISRATIKQFKNVIIDETSMVDLLKFEKLLKIFNFKEPSFKRLILIGDSNQLPAIGYGRVLADVINYIRSSNSHQNNFIQLETNCRSELKDNQVLDLAEAFKQKGELEPNLKRKFDDKEIQISNGFRTRYWESKDKLYIQITEEFKKLAANEGINGNLHESLNQILGLKSNGDIINSKTGLENFQILSPYQAQFSGASKINDFIQTEFKKGAKYELRKNLYKKSDKLIRTKNYYQNKKLLLSNGTLGFIGGKNYREKFFHEDKEGLKNIPFSDIRSMEQEFFELAYAVTVHKSQGSGFNHLFVVIPARYGLLSKELIYTALTRTKKSITLFLQANSEKSKSVLEIAMSRSFSASRRTSLMLDKPYRFYDLEPEPGIYVESRIELLIYHLLMKKRDDLGKDIFDFAYEEKPIIDGEEINIKTDFTVYVNSKEWYWEHLGLLEQRKYSWTWKNIKTKTYKDAGIWNNVISTDERNGINPLKIETIIDLIIEDKVETEDKYHRYSNHHYYLR
ncbi:ATP-dependent DNA helicase [Zobellia nedashkovskayae]|uniref:ATP-dependent DNA helicase n=1 Tax=Zobellia nedashkovskayae TaxID=2779510 RepID=UPI00188D485B|nr:AAA family ATPase [Zobellia nedashkovskayae]